MSFESYTVKYKDQYTDNLLMTFSRLNLYQYEAVLTADAVQNAIHQATMQAGRAQEVMISKALFGKLLDNEEE